MSLSSVLRPRWPGTRALLVDLAIAILAGVLVVGSSWWSAVPAAHWWNGSATHSFGPPSGHSPFGSTGSALTGPVLGLLWLAALAIAVRRVVPVWSTVLTSLSAVSVIVLRAPLDPVLVVGAFQVASLGSQVPLRTSLPVAAGTSVLWLLGAAAAGQPYGELAADAIGWSLLLGVPWALGYVLWTRARLRRRALAEEERRRAYGQRLEVAREVHDVVGHSLSVITMQAGIALHVMDRRPEQARVALEAIHVQSRDALDELRATLALYRGEPAPGIAPRRPQPRLADVPELIATMRRSGLPVELSTSGQRDGVPAAVDLAGFRIVQEALTNVLRHAGTARARVAIGYEPGAIEIEVSDDGAARPGMTLNADGHGIDGMRERSAAIGGTLDAGPCPDGGFRVHARLPLSGAPA